MQAQVPQNPYVALWSRLRRLRSAELSGADRAPAVVRARSCARPSTSSPRATRCDRPVMQPVLARTFTSPLARALARRDLEEVVAAGRALLGGARARAPSSRGCSRRAGRTPTRWRSRTRSRSTRARAGAAARPLGRERPGHVGAAEAWLGASAEPRPRRSTRWCCATSRAFGPATVADIRTWSGLTGLREVVERCARSCAPSATSSGRELSTCRTRRCPTGHAGPAALPARVRQPPALARRPLPRLRRPRAACRSRAAARRHAARRRLLPRRWRSLAPSARRHRRPLRRARRARDLLDEIVAEARASSPSSRRSARARVASSRGRASAAMPASALSTSSSWVFGEAFGMTWRTTPLAVDDERRARAPQYVLPYIDFSTQTPYRVADGVVLVGEQREVQRPACRGTS